MPRFYFDIERALSRIDDDEGCELANLADAQQLGLELLGESIIFGRLQPGSEVRVEIRDEEIILLRLCAVLSISGNVDASVCKPPAWEAE